jgi:hypothetical protein
VSVLEELILAAQARNFDLVKLLFDFIHFELEDLKLMLTDQ